MAAAICSALNVTIMMAGVVANKGKKKRDTRKLKKDNASNREDRSESLVMLEKYAESHEHP